jgi:hypothetical protein
MTKLSFRDLMAYGVATPSDWLEPWEVTTHPRKRRRPRKPTLTAALKQALKAGKPVRGAEITPDGVKLTFGEPEATEHVNPWLADLDKVTRQ